MKRINCNIIKDILPLYIESVVSADTKTLIEEHVSECENCGNELKRMQTPIKLAADTDATHLKRIRKTWHRKKLWVSIMTAAIITVLFMAGLYLYQLELPVNYSETQIWTEEVTMQGGLKSFQVTIRGRNIEMVEASSPTFKDRDNAAYHYKIIRTTFLRNLFDSGDRSVSVGVPEYWREIDNFESNIVIEFADKTVLYRNGKEVE
ncbi:putative zinc finger protein [Desulfitobacterium sp. LBE]|uniref:zf-HC2 domain-containing protein n=1 Tax=Desulfitobacterium sp. LBE TaxID=884086 RepID=UPI0011998B3E|nr:zf-HC2 domain-containing protein [Desulfitobacterium sp. LBE]TWH58320.1 putative zinc finger protein [Desulfitobacterium sp. LBE]